MQQQTQGVRLYSWGLIGLLAFAPLVRGGRQDWAALAVVGGIVGLLVLMVLRGLWSGTLPVVWSRHD